MKELKIKQLAQGLTYSRSEMLGKGAFGQVYLGFEQSRKAACAIKIVNIEKMSIQISMDTLLKKIKDEIVNMQIAQHESVVQFYQAKKSNNNIYIVCEYCNGESLAQLIRRRKYLTEWEALGYFREILRGFQFLHRQKIVHRDLKPANLLLHNYSIRIGDLGFSKATEHHEQVLTSIVGSPLYMSPQIFEREGYTQKTDIWSLGCILYEMLYGHNPFDGCNNLYELRERVKKEVVFGRYPVVSGEVKRAIRRMLVVREAERIGWEGLFAEFLDNKEGEIEVEKSVGSVYKTSRKVVGHFRNSFNLESRFQLPKLAKEMGLLSEEELGKCLGGYGSSEQFYSQLLFVNQNKGLIEEYYRSYFERRNELSFMMLLIEKASMVGVKSNLQVTVYCYCVVLLSLRYCLALIEEMLDGEKLILLQQRFEPFVGRFGYGRLLVQLLKRDRQMIKQEYVRFRPFFEGLMSQISSHILGGVVQKDISGIYNSVENEKRLIKFFMQNYLKKIFNLLKTVVRAPQKGRSNGQMVSEEEEMEVEEEEERPATEVVLLKMIGEYLTNAGLFKERQDLDKKVYDWETTTKQHFFAEIKNVQAMKQDSIDSFLKKEIVWRQMLLPRLR